METENRLLVVVDMQKDFVDGALGSDAAKAIVPNVVRKVKAAKHVVFTRDTHGDDYLGTQEGRRLPVKHCIAGTDGHEIIDDLRPYIGKSSVTDKRTFGSTQLASYISELWKFGYVEEVELVGLCTDICVISNAMVIKAFCPEIRVLVDASCCAGVTRESHDTALAAMQACQIDILNWRDSK